MCRGLTDCSKLTLGRMNFYKLFSAYPCFPVKVGFSSFLLQILFRTRITLCFNHNFVLEYGNIFVFVPNGSKLKKMATLTFNGMNRGAIQRVDVGEHEIIAGKAKYEIPISKEHSTNAEEWPSKNVSKKILSELMAIHDDEFQASRCIFNATNVEICYTVKDSATINEEKLRQKLASRFGIEADRIELTKLRSAPIFKETNIEPGDRVHLGDASSQCAIGAFVDVPGKGIHALMSGHGKTVGNKVYKGGELLGEVVVTLDKNTPPPRNPDGLDLIYRDISLTKLTDETQHNSTVSNNSGAQIQLNEYPKDPKKDMEVRLFTSGDRHGKIQYSHYYNITDPHTKASHRMISVVDDRGCPVHGEGESGTLIATNPTEIPSSASTGVVRADAVGMLIGSDTLPLASSDNDRKSSLAIPLLEAFQILENDPYSNHETLRFC